MASICTRKSHRDLHHLAVTCTRRLSYFFSPGKYINALERKLFNMPVCKRCKSRIIDDELFDELDGLCPRCYKLHMEERFVKIPKIPLIFLISTLYLFAFLGLWVLIYF
ncbi:MAG: hypothetical protein ACTSUE_27005 [Promethearchaeota archaeon]